MRTALPALLALAVGPPDPSALPKPARANAIVASEAPIARRFFDQMGIEATRVTYEGEARTTAENAERLRDMLHPEPGMRWLLVTSGWHMPRSIGAFRAAGFDVVAFPVDYRTRGPQDRYWPIRNIAEGLTLLDLAVREYIGLAAYRMTGRSSAKRGTAGSVRYS